MNIVAVAMIRDFHYTPDGIVFFVDVRLPDGREQTMLELPPILASQDAPTRQQYIIDQVKSFCASGFGIVFTASDTIQLLTPT